jgi:hypothetical protein
MDLFRTAIIPAANVVFARGLVAALSPGGAGMFTTPLSASGNTPATHFISSGMISAAIANLMPLQTWAFNGSWTLTGSTPGPAAVVHQAAVAAGFSCTLAEVQNLFTAADGTEQPPFDAMARLGLKIIDFQT